MSVGWGGTDVRDKDIDHLPGAISPLFDEYNNYVCQGSRTVGSVIW